jgi:hypothetical protein
MFHVLQILTKMYKTNMYTIQENCVEPKLFKLLKLRILNSNKHNLHEYLANEVVSKISQRLNCAFHNYI